MEYYIYKMIFRIFLWLTFLKVLYCHPLPQNFKLPELDVSTPEEVNSLEQDEPVERSVTPNKQKNNIDDTVKEVEDIIKSNPALPRLTRGEILDLLENITYVDDQKTKILGKNRDSKAIMVVMPFTPSNDKDMEDLYTKAPITHMIGAEPFKTKEEITKPKHTRRRPPVKFNDADNNLAKKPHPNEEKKKYLVDETSTKPIIASANQVRRRRPDVTTEKIEIIPTTYRPKPTLPTTYHPKTRRPVRRKTTTIPSPIHHLNHRYPEEFLPTNGIRIIDSPKLTRPQEKYESLSDMALGANTKQEIVMKQEIPMPLSFVTMKPNIIKVTTTASTTTKRVIEDIHLPDNLKTVMKDLNLEQTLNPKHLEDKLKSTMEEQNRIKNMLASIGVLSETTSTMKTTSIPNAENVADSLSSEMRDLLMNFGLLPTSTERTVITDSDKYYPDKAEVNPESYIGFKPLPDDGPSRHDMDALLASFGLGRSARKNKAIKTKNNREYNFDMIPDHLKGIITDLGISQLNREEKKLETPNLVKTEEKQHVFSPDEQYATEDELKKLDKLLDMIKQLEKINGSATEEDLKKIDLEGLKELVRSLNGHNNETFVTLDQFNSPNPNNFDFGFTKNEIKRQETTTKSTTTVEAETPSISDLESSFGGQTEAPTQPPISETTTRKTGFYYLVDWNTFLDIDDTKGRRVNLRFQPTIGDPKRFLSVSVP